MIQGKPVRLRVSRLAKDGDGLFCLDLSFRDALLDLAERMEWSRVWVDDDGKSIELDDAQRQIIEKGLSALTMSCEIVINNIIENPPPTVNNSTEVNCSCGGGGGSLFNPPTLIDLNGDPIATTCLPLDPNNPTGDLEGIEWDDLLETTPPGWTDFNEFSNHRCIIANYAIDAFGASVKKIDEIENILSPVLDVLSLVLLVVPVPIGKLRGAATLLKWVSKLRVATVAAKNLVDNGEEILDYAQMIDDWIVENRQTAVCLAYSATNTPELTAELLSQITALFPQEAGEFMDKYISALSDYLNTVLGDTIDTMMTAKAVELIEEGYQPKINCAAVCGQPVPITMRVNGVASGTPSYPGSWANGQPLYESGGVVLSYPDAVAVPEYWQTPEIVNFLSLTRTYNDGYGIRLNTRTAPTTNRLQGYLSSNSDMKSFIVDGYYGSSSFAKVFCRITGNGQILLHDVEMVTPVGYSPTTKAVNLPDALPPGTVCQVQITSTGGNDEFITEAYFYPEFLPFNTSGAG